MVNAAVPNVPPVPILRVDESVPERASVLFTVNVFDVVPPAIVKPVPKAERVSPLTVVGVMFPSPIVNLGIVEIFVQVAVTPLFAVAVSTDVTVPLPLAAIFPFNFCIACNIVSVS